MNDSTFSFGQPVTIKAEAVRCKKYGSYGPAWEGEPLPDTHINPDDGKSAVMIRRFPRPAKGIVIGHTWREEGYVDGGAWDGGGVLLSARRVPLWEVAIEGQGKASILLVYEPDMEAIT